MNYIPTTPEQRAEMLSVCGVSSIDELFADIPESLIPAGDGYLASAGLSEQEVLRECARLAGANVVPRLSFAGGGFYDHHIPAAIDALVSRSEFYTAYTPYQPELSQGTLQAIYEYQSQICRLTGMEISNASLYDGGTAIFEACSMAIAHNGRRKVVIDRGVNPVYREILGTHTASADIEVVEVPVLPGGVLNREEFFGALGNDVACVITQNPNYFGIVDDHSDITGRCKEAGIVTIQSVYPIALALIKTPAEQGFDIAVGEGQSLGIPLSFGGPYLGFIGARRELSRRMPGRIAARTTDTHGRDGFVLSLQAREQHIRREKATSNICSNSALNALRAHVYLSLAGTEGLKEVAALCHSKAIYARGRISAIKSVKVSDAPIFNEFMVELPVNASKLVRCDDIVCGIPAGQYYSPAELGETADNMLLIAVTEKHTKEDIDVLVDRLEIELEKRTCL